jgi:hypothetical protein
MLKQISWSNYWTTIMIITLSYYLIIAFVFYRNSILSILTRSKNSSKNNKDITHDPEEQENQVQ